MLPGEVKKQTTQRLALQQVGDQLVLSTWPGELKAQARRLYRNDHGIRASALVDLVTHDERWSVRPNPYLAYRWANTPGQRLYLTSDLEVEEYVQRWAGDDFDRVGAHASDQVRERLWPWLHERGYAGPQDDDLLDGYLRGLGNRDAHLRPGLAVSRTWPWDVAVALDEQGAFLFQLREAITTVLTALRQPVATERADATTTFPLGPDNDWTGGLVPDGEYLHVDEEQ